MEATDLARKTAELANRDVGERETDGPNNSPRIRQYGATVHITPPAPYCAAAVCTWIKEAAQALTITPALKFSGSSLHLAEINPTLQIQPAQLQPDDLPCIGILNHGQGKGHTFLAVGYDPDTGKVQTIEANSNGAGSREGQGVYALDIRTIHDAQLQCFIRIV